MKKILSNCPISCFADEISVSLDRQIQALNELGIKFVEFRSADGTGVADFTDEQAKEAKKRLDASWHSRISSRFSDWKNRYQ